ncbi:MAG: hypothetical protein IKT00_03200 [Prevotella sp.]|nr:hypothetical protein [Prevotella sp.]
MKRTARLLVAAASLLWALTFSSCGDVQNEYTVRTAYFVFDNSVHQNIVLSSAMNINAPGTFCKVKPTMVSGARAYVFENNYGQTETSVENAIDQRRTVILGYNNSLIVGFGNLDMPAVFYAYDGECPNCFDPQKLPVHSYPLTMTGAGLAVCSTCQREYNMNSGGNIVKGDGGDKMIRYRASCTGPLGTLAVN